MRIKFAPDLTTFPDSLTSKIEKTSRIYRGFPRMRDDGNGERKRVIDMSNLVESVIYEAVPYCRARASPSLRIGET